jgi:lipid-A-disaccharide synthase-like uncharacterized protein
MKLELNKIDYENLNPKQKESYNFQKLSAVLADYGVETLRLSNDWNGADFLMTDPYNVNVIKKVQLKSRFTLDRKYRRIKDLYIAFPDSNIWYIFHHNTILDRFSKVSNLNNDSAWKETGKYSQARLTEQLKELLHEFQVSDKIEYQLCPICLSRYQLSYRYPNQICDVCFERTTDKSGVPIKFYNKSIMGNGVQGKYIDSKRDYDDVICYVNNIACIAKEHHFGGIVIEKQLNDNEDFF